jgi:hypothetical protein
MRISIMKALVLAPLLCFAGLVWIQAQDTQPIKLTEPNKKGGLPVMEALSIRASAGSWSDKELSSQDPSELLGAANGVNRPII